MDRCAIKLSSTIWRSRKRTPHEARFGKRAASQSGLDLTCAQSERIVILRRGKPYAVLVGIEDYDAEDLRLASSEEFWQMIRQRRTSGKSISIAEVEEQLGITSEKAHAKPVAPGNRERIRDRICSEEPVQDLQAPCRSFPGHTHRPRSK